VFADSLGFTVSFESIPGERGGWCDQKARRIVVDADAPANAQPRILFHEIAHALLHLIDHDGPELSYAEEEIVVESIAFSVVGGLGIDTSGYSIPYLTSWSQDDADMEIVEACAELIDHHAKRIENAIGDPPDPTATSETTEPRAPAGPGHPRPAPELPA
jgi:hypothetical protein